MGGLRPTAGSAPGRPGEVTAPGPAARRLVAWAAAAALALPAAGATASSALPRLGAARNFALTTQQNDRLWLTQLRDRVVVLTFLCTTCEACPRLLPSLADLARALGDAAGRRVFFVGVTVDPLRDTAAVLRQFARDQGLSVPAWLLLTGKAAEVDAVARWYGADVERQDGAVTYRCRVILIDGAGVIRARYDAHEVDRLPDALKALLLEPGHS